MSHYITLPSHANRCEFPNNQANRFKIRLPQSLRLNEGSWQVALSSVTIPDAGLNVDYLVPPGQDLLASSVVRKDTEDKFIYRFITMNVQAIKEDESVVDGVSLMKAYLRWYEQQVVDEFKTKYGATAEDKGLSTQLLFEWDDQDLLLTNDKVGRHSFKYKGVDFLMPHFVFNVVFGEKMGWMKKQMMFDKTPARNAYDFVDLVKPPKYFKTYPGKNNATWIVLDLSINWKLTNLNVMFQTIVHDPKRTLHVYTDVVGSSMVGDRVVNLLREIKYHRQGRGQIYYEPIQLQYVPANKQVLEIIEVHITETIGDVLVPFKSDHSIVTLHFKKEV